MRDVEKKHIKNSTILIKLQSNSLHQRMELRQAKWLENVANMPATPNPRKVFVCWVQKPHPPRHPHQTIRDAYSTTVEYHLGFQSSKFNVWMPIAKEKKHGKN